jgi:HEAT repeat protein
VPAFNEAFSRLAKSPNRDIRQALAKGVKYLPRAMAGVHCFTEFANLLFDSENKVQRVAAESLVLFGPIQDSVVFREAVPRLVLHEDYFVRTAAIDSLVKLEYTDEALSQDITNALFDEHDETRTAGAEAVELLPRPVDYRVVEQLKQLMSDGNDIIRSRAFSAFAGLGPMTATDLVEILLGQGDSGQILTWRHDFIRSLASTSASPESLKQILSLLDSNNRTFRGLAVDMLGVVIDHSNRRNISCELAKRLRSNNYDRLWEVLGATNLLGSQASSHPEIAEAIKQLFLRNPRLVLSSLDSGILGRVLRFVPFDLFQQLVQGLCRKGMTHTLDEVSALAPLVTEPQIFSYLADLITGGDYATRCAALKSVARIGKASATPAIITALLSVLARSSWLGDSDAIAALEAIEPDELRAQDWEIVKEMITTSDPPKIDALSALSHMLIQKGEAAEWLVDLLGSASTYGRQEVVDLIGQLAADACCEDFLEALRRRLKKESLLDPASALLNEVAASLSDHGLLLFDDQHGGLAFQTVRALSQI